ncbi:MAG TPA: sulfatase-like hydrolase/transferase [Gemmatimonadales bacterium]|nr:sulfatase-like hydrolase/transferase [Gemmatimonadales bacterium]
MQSRSEQNVGSAFRRILAVSIALFLLNASLTFQSAWPTPGIRWRGVLSIELAVFILVLVAVSRSVGAPSRRALGWFAAIWSLLVLGHYAEVTATALYGREINLYWDLRFVPDVAALLARPERLWVVVLAAFAALVILVLLYKLLRWALGRVGAAMAHPRERFALGALAATMAIFWVGQRVNAIVPGTPGFSAPVTQTYVRQVGLMVATLGRSTELLPGPAMNSDLSLVKGADVFLFFIEAYGAISYERPEFAARLTADRGRLEAAIHGTNREVVSAYVESPTFGGSSWLAHITLLSAVDIRSHDANARLMTEKRETLVTAFKQHGYRTVAVMPGLWQNWPEGSFYKFDEIYGGARLDYRGPTFGWWDMTDQFVLARMDALEVQRAPRRPLFVFFPTISTHIPFTPTPPYQPDWARVLTNDPYDEADVKHAYLRQPDWMDLGHSYADAIAYMYQSMAGYLRLRADRDFVMILIGDHQPAAAVSGEGAPWDVPVHIIASRRPVLDRLLAHGFRSGLTPSRPALGPMNTLTATLLEALGNREIAVARVP